MIFQSIDSTSGYTVNFLGIDSLRDALRYDNPIEEGHFHFDKNRKVRKRKKALLLPYSNLLKKCSKELEDYAKLNYLNYEVDFNIDKKHEYLKFDYAAILKFLLKMYKLDILAENIDNVEIAITLDGRKLTNRLFHVTAGLKIVDVYARHLKLGTLFLSTDVETSSISSM